MKTRLFYYMLLLLGMSFVACDDGEDGLPGEQGPQGEQGLQGEQGEPGNANVQVYEKDISNMTWEVSSNNNYLYLDIPAPNVLTEETLNTSTILVYVYTSDFFAWAIVPYYTERGIRVTAHINVGNIQLRKDQNGNPSTQSWHNNVRIVVIENSSTDPGPLNRQRENDAIPAIAIDMTDYPASALQKLQ